MKMEYHVYLICQDEGKMVYPYVVSYDTEKEAENFCLKTIRNGQSCGYCNDYDPFLSHLTGFRRSFLFRSVG